jgi:pimeloyl-ACP methyl ester carboxylesterase
MQVTFYHNNKNLNYTTQGNGMPVVLIHGLAEDHSIWDETAAELSSDYRLIIPDLPGSGFSELSELLSIDSMAEACKAILDKEDLGLCVLIGHSMGGYVALALAEKFPDMVMGLGLFHSTAYADDEDKIASRKKNISFILKHGTAAFMQQATPTLFSSKSKEERPEMISYLINKYSDFKDESLVAYQQAMIRRPDRSAVLENIVKPVLFIIGKEDKAIPFDLSMRQSHLPAVSFIDVLEHSGHMGMMEEFEESLEILKMFLAELQRLQSE